MTHAEAELQIAAITDLYQGDLLTSLRWSCLSTANRRRVALLVWNNFGEAGRDQGTLKQIRGELRRQISAASKVLN